MTSVIRGSDNFDSGNTGVDFIATPPNFASPTTTYTSSGTYSRGSTSSSQLVWVYLVAGGNGGGHSNIGEGGSYRFVIATADTLDSSAYTIGAGGTSGGDGSASSITVDGTTYSTADSEKITVIDGALPTGIDTTYIDMVIYAPVITDSGYNFTPHPSYARTDGTIFSGASSHYIHSDGSGGGGGFGRHSLYAGNSGNSRIFHSNYSSLSTYNSGPTNGSVPGGGGGASYNGGSSNGGAGNMRIYHI